MEKLLPPGIRQKSGYEYFFNKEIEFNLCIIDFWRWALSNLSGGSTLKMLGEFIVTSALNRDIEMRNEVDVYNLKTENDKKIGVLSASHLQTWSKNGLPNISYTNNPCFKWDDNFPMQSSERLRLVELFVFCLLQHRNEHTLNPVDISQWTFFVIDTNLLQNSLIDKKGIKLSKLKELNPIMCGFDTLKRVIEGY